MLRFGDLRYLPSARPDVLAFERTLNEDRVIVVLNRHPTEGFDASSLRPERVLRRIPDTSPGDGWVPALGAVVWLERQRVDSTRP